MVGVVSSRIRELSPAARTVHRAILRSFAATGDQPDMAALAAAVPPGHDLPAVLGELHDRDVVRLDERGGIRAAYPFCATPTPHQVLIEGGSTVSAMCAIDALGMAAMLDAAISISSTDPSSGEPVQVTVRPDGQATWRPDTTVVVDGTDTRCCPPDGAGRCTVAAADSCCGVMNFFTGTATAQAWLASHPHVAGPILTGEQALRVGVDIFGRLLDD